MCPWLVVGAAQPAKLLALVCDAHSRATRVLADAARPPDRPALDVASSSVLALAYSVGGHLPLTQAVPENLRTGPCGPAGPPYGRTEHGRSRRARGLSPGEVKGLKGV